MKVYADIPAVCFNDSSIWAKKVKIKGSKIVTVPGKKLPFGSPLKIMRVYLEGEN
jgi:hypothetical protein